MVKQIKILLPTISIPEFDGKSKEEQDAMLAIYIMQFGNLNYQITLKALNNIIYDEKKMEKFTKTPIPTLARESVNLTAFTEEEKRKHKESQEVRYTHSCREPNIMKAYNKITHEHVPEKDRPKTTIEDDFWNHNMMTEEEYDYWKWGKAQGRKKPSNMQYNPITRKRNDYTPQYEDFEDEKQPF